MDCFFRVSDIWFEIKLRLDIINLFVDFELDNLSLDGSVLMYKNLKISK